MRLRVFPTCIESEFVMAGLDPAIHVFLVAKHVDARHKAGHDDDHNVSRRTLAFNRHRSHLRINRLQQHLDPALRNVPDNENNPAASVIGRPAIEPGGRVKDMLDAVDHRRSVGAFGNVHDALETEQIGAAVLCECFEKER